MPGRAEAHYTVALQGFSEFERSALISFFRLAVSRTPAYSHVERLQDSDFVIADADDAASLRGALALERPEDTVYIGRASPLGAMHWLPRPIEPTRIVRALDAIVEQRTLPMISLTDLMERTVPMRRAAADVASVSGPPPAEPALPPHEPTVPAELEAPMISLLSPTTPEGRTLPPTPLTPPPLFTSQRLSAASPVPLQELPPSSPAPPPVQTPKVRMAKVDMTMSSGPSIAGFVDNESTGPDVLIADDSRIARRFLQLRLQKLGYRVHMASDGDEALELLMQQRFELVFLDITLGSVDSLDGLALCQHLKQHPDFAAGDGPKVVMVTGHSGASDRVRGSLAGCDAYLTKPLTEPDLVRALHGLDPGLLQRQKGATGA